MRIFILHACLAFLWLLLAAERNLQNLTVGFLLGFAALVLFRTVLGCDDYVRRTIHLLLFIPRFLRLFLVSNLAIAAAVLTRPRRAMRPDFVTYDISGLQPLEILLISHLISVTPGTTTTAIRTDRQTLVLHAFDASDPAALCAQLDRTLKEPILRFTR